MRFGPWGGLLAGLMLSACNGVGDLAGLVPGDPVRSLALAGGAVQAVGPDNFCVDTRASRARAGFAIMAPCVLLGADGPGVPGLAVITVQVGDAGTASVAGSEPAFRAFLESDAGIALLSASATPDAITLRQTRAGNGVVTAFFDDSGTPPIAGTQPTEWRGFADINGRLVTVALRGLAEAPLSVSVGDALLRQTLGAMQSANAAETATES